MTSKIPLIANDYFRTYAWKIDRRLINLSSLIVAERNKIPLTYVRSTTAQVSLYGCAG